jgi:hypothetical protein
MKNTRRHYPKEPITFSLLPNVWQTSGTMCNKRRKVDWVTDQIQVLTCAECVENALTYWTEQRDTCESLIQYADNGQLKGTSAEKKSKELLPQIRVALSQAQRNVVTLAHKLAEMG